jgi:hypothetical protein
MPLLIEHSKSEDEQIRNVVAESIGRLYIIYSRYISSDLDHSFKSSNPLERSTIVKSFKFAASKETDPMDLENSLEYLLKSI